VKQEIIDMVKERAKGYCEVCGKPEQASMALHHRKLKSRGGKDEVSNLIRICHKCHNLGTKSIHMNPMDAENKGWMVGSWQDPEEAEFLRPDGTKVFLLNNGSIKQIER
jgi:HNH endonuclease